MKEKPPFALANYTISPDPHSPRESLTRLVRPMFRGHVLALPASFPLLPTFKSSDNTANVGKKFTKLYLIFWK